MATVLIKNGLVCDGTESPAVKKDIFIKDDYIIGLEPNLKAKADLVIDALGGLVTPGIIDVNTDSDHYLSLFTEPTQADFIKQGVTSILGGNCGVSLAPLINQKALNLFRKWVDISKVNFNWHSTADFLNLINRKKIGVNFGTFVGYETLRQALFSGSEGDLTDSQLQLIQEMLSAALTEGALGLSLDLTAFYGRRISYFEIVNLAKIVVEAKKILTVHLANSHQEIIDVVKEIIDFVEETGVNTEINHFQPWQRLKVEYKTVQTLLEATSARLLINYDCYPFNEVILPIYAFLPAWFQEENRLRIWYYVISENFENKILDHFKNFNLTKIKINYAPPPFSFLNGKSLIDFAANHELDLPRAFLRLMRLSQLQAWCVYEGVDEELLEKFMLSDQALIASNGAALSPADFKFRHERNSQTFPKFLKWAVESNHLTLEKAVAKLTGVPAQKYGLIKRGFIKTGYFADLAVWYDFQPTEVLVNGQAVLRDSQLTGLLNGYALVNSKN